MKVGNARSARAAEIDGPEDMSKIAVLPQADEDLETYLLRCLQIAQRYRTWVTAARGDMRGAIYPTMDAETLRRVARGDKT